MRAIPEQSSDRRVPSAEWHPPAPGQPHEMGPQQKRRMPGLARLPVAAAVAALWAALLSYAPVTLVMGLVYLDNATASVADTARLGLSAWLLAHGVPVDTGVGQFALPPLAVTVLAAWRLARAGVHTSRAIGARQRVAPQDAAVVAAAVGVVYGLLGALAATVAEASGPAGAPLRAGGTLAVFGAVAALAGALPATGALSAVALRTPTAARDGLRTGLVAACLVLAAGAGVAGLAVAMKSGDAADLIAAYQTGTAGQAGITLVSVAFAPNVAVWAAAYVLGPGFAVGTDTVVRTTEVTTGVLPALPLAAGLPEGPLDGLGAALLAVPVVAGMVAGWLLARRHGREAAPSDRASASRVRAAEQRSSRDSRAAGGWSALVAPAALAGPAAGLVLGLVAFASAGSVGGGRLAELGPNGWQVAAAATVLVGIGSVVGAATGRVMGGR